MLLYYGSHPLGDVTNNWRATRSMCLHCGSNQPISPLTLRALLKTRLASLT